MTDTTAGRPEDAAADTEAAGGHAPTEEARIAALVETLARENAEAKDRLLRTLAEMENLRRRTEREVADARQYGVASFARDVLAVADNMDRALQALDAELRETANPGVKALLDGVELTERELLKVLEKHGIKRMVPQGQKFDPNFHQAMYEVPDSSVPAGSIVQVIQPGYTIGERMLRPAMVAIAKSDPGASKDVAQDSARSAAGIRTDRPSSDD